MLTTELPATPREVYDAWMSSNGHSAMTGSPAVIDARVGGKHTAWDGYITGVTQTLVPGKRIAQTWRTSEFTKAHQDSRIELSLEPSGNAATRLTLRHSNVPSSQASDYKSGWVESYFEPMKTYFSSKHARRKQ